MMPIWLDFGVMLKNIVLWERVCGSGWLNWEIRERYTLPNYGELEKALQRLKNDGSISTRDFSVNYIGMRLD